MPLEIEEDEEFEIAMQGKRSVTYCVICSFICVLVPSAGTPLSFKLIVTYALRSCIVLFT
jgi:hypothetical protein